MIKPSVKVKLLASVLAIALFVSCFASLPGFAAASGPFYVAADQSASGSEGYYSTLTDALAAVKDGGTVEMTSNYTAAERVDGVAKSWTLDGKGYTWTSNDSTKVDDSPYCIRLGYDEKTITIKNTTFDYAGTSIECTRLLQASNKSCHIILSAGTKFTHTGSANLARGFMKQAAAKLTIDGAVFEIDAPAISTWGEGVHHIVINSGTLSFGIDPFSGKEFAIGNGYQPDSVGSTLTGEGNINVYTGSTVRPLIMSDIGLTNATINLTKTPGTAPTGPENTIAYITIGTNATKYYSLNDAFNAAATSGDTLTVHGEFAVASKAILEKNLTIIGADANAAIVAKNANVITIGNGKLTLKDITVKNKGASSKESATICFGYSDTGFTGGTLILNSGTKILNESSPVTGNTGGNAIAVLFTGNNNLTINDGAYIKGAGSAVCSERGKLTIEMNGGTIYATYRALNLANAATSFTMNGGTVQIEKSKGQQNGTENGAWCICDYGRGANIRLNEGTIIAPKGESCYLIGKATSNLFVGDKVVFKTGNNALDSNITISNNHMYLYIPSEATTAENAAMAFAAKVSGTAVVKESGMLIIPEKLLGNNELTMSSDMVLKIADSNGLTANGYTECGVTGVAAGLAKIDSKMCARPYVIVELDLGAVKIEKVIYGTQMIASGADFANAYKAQNANWESNANVKAIVDTFAALTASN